MPGVLNDTAIESGSSCIGEQVHLCTKNSHQLFVQENSDTDLPKVKFLNVFLFAGTVKLL